MTRLAIWSLEGSWQEGVPVVAVDGSYSRCDLRIRSRRHFSMSTERLLISSASAPNLMRALEATNEEAREQIQRPSRGGRHGAIGLTARARSSSRHSA